MSDMNDLIKAGGLFDGHYKLLRPLSTDGATADVWLAIDTNTIDATEYSEEDGDVSGKYESGMLVAIKIYRPKNALDVEGERRFREEFRIVYECRHENLLQPTSFSIFDDIPYLVLPYCKYGSSEQLIGKKQSDDEIWKFILDVSSGLNRLHTNDPQIVHQDIKPANILIDNGKDYAITDFGISSRRGGAHGCYFDDENSGTLAYMAPERFGEGSEPMPQSDIWAFGATLFEILTGNVPFGEEGGMAQASGMAMPSMSGVPVDIQRLILACLAKEPKDRPTADNLRKAALAKRFSHKPRLLLYAVSAVAMMLLLFLAFFVGKSDKPDEKVDVSCLYETALRMISSDDAGEVKAGVHLMDSLSGRNYVPAIYQMAFTYGWYIDSTSLKRKRALGIEVFENEREGKCLPKQDRYNTDAVTLFRRILALNDSTYAQINAQAAYRLACYYVMPNKIFKSNYKEGKRFLEISKEWATKANDADLLDKINRSLDSFDEE